MRILFFDTETTGLPADYKAPIENVDNWPRLVSLSWQIFNFENEDFELIKEQDFIVKCDFDIPLSASKVHGITSFISKEKGHNLLKVLVNFIDDMNGIDLFVGHNINFDKKILGAEFYRNLEYNPLSGKEKICTMFKSTKYCKIPSPKGGYKWPKLEELHISLFGSNFENAHNSLADVRATSKCFFELVRLGVISINN